MRILIGIQARTNSRRLPGKIHELIGDKTMLEHVVETCKQVNVLNRVNQYTVAVLYPEGDLKVIDECQRIGVEYWAGDEHDLYKRYLGAMDRFESEAMVRVTADCWMIPKEMIEEAISCLTEADYAANTIIRSFVEGWDIQAATRKGIEWMSKNQTEEREHIFKTFDENQMVRDEFVGDGLVFRAIVNSLNPIFQKTSIDTKEDLERARKVYENRKQQHTVEPGK